MTLTAAIIWFVVSLVLILGGADFLTDGASGVARRFGVSDLFVGLTVVAFGTSTPELTISVIASIQGNGSLAVGNVVGSNIANILLIIGLTALIRPIAVSRRVIRSEMPVMLLSSVIVLILACGPLTGSGDAVATVSRTDGLLLLVLFAIFMRHTFASAKDTANNTPGGDRPQGDRRPTALWKDIVYVTGGLGALLWGGDRFVASASAIASASGMSDGLIGLTVVAVGTSLPELAASAVAAVKGRQELAVGNVIGSNVFNVLLVLGASSTVAPLSFGTVGMTDVVVLLGASLLFYVWVRFGRHNTVSRAGGAVMLAAYVAYTAWLVINNVG